MYVISFNFVNPNQMHFYSHIFSVIDFEETGMRVGTGGTGRTERIPRQSKLLQ